MEFLYLYLHITSVLLFSFFHASYVSNFSYFLKLSLLLNLVTKSDSVEMGLKLLLEMILEMVNSGGLVHIDWLGHTLIPVMVCLHAISIISCMCTVWHLVSLLNVV